MPDTSMPPEKGRRIRRRPDPAVVDEVRSAFAKADAARKRRPGRGALVRLTGGTAYQVRRAIATVKAEQQATTKPASTKPATTQPPARTSTNGSTVNSQVPGTLVLTKPVTQSSPGPPPGRRQNGVRLATTTTPAPPSNNEFNTQSNAESITAANHQSPTGPPPEVEPGGEPESPSDPPADASQRTSQRQPVRPPRAWPLGLIGLAAAVAVWGGWVDLGRLTGFGMVQPLPGLVDGFWINSAIVLPIGIEAYGGYALRTWLSFAALSEKTRRYAGWSALASLIVGAGAQVASHLMKAVHITVAP